MPLSDNYSGATEQLREALALYRARDDQLGEANARLYLGAGLRLDLARTIPSAWDEAHAPAGLGRCALAAGGAEQAVARLREALDIFRQLGTAEAAGVAKELDAIRPDPGSAEGG